MKAPSQNVFSTKCICPNCIKTFYPGECKIISTITGRVLKNAPTGRQKHTARLSPEPLTGREYTSQLACRVCPYCEYVLPFNIERVPNIPIMILGDSFCGKSSYLAALMLQLEQGRWMSQNHYVRVSCLTPSLRWQYIVS